MPGSCDPLAACCTTSVEGSRPLKIISFRWSHIAHSVAKMVCHSASRGKGPWQIDCQKASPAVTSISPRAAAVHTGWTIGHSKNKWEQSSGFSLHNLFYSFARFLSRILPLLPIQDSSTSPFSNTKSVDASVLLIFDQNWR